MKAIKPFIIPNFTIARMKARIGASVLLMTTIILLTAATVLSFSTSQTYAQEDNNNCDPSYPDACISPPSPDLDCGDIPDTDFTVLAPDPHGLDSEGDGIGCEN
jgi:hypothetical protein